jgi:hypothetical protein
LATGSPRRLGIGFVGAGFMNRFHVQSLVGVRDCEAAGVFSPTRAHAESLAGLARALRVGEPRVHASLADLAADPAVDALWIATPNDLRVEIVEEIVELVRSGPRAARRTRLREAAGADAGRGAADAAAGRGLRAAARLSREPAVSRPRCSAATTSSGAVPCPTPAGPTSRAPPRSTADRTMPWFWQGEQQGGGVLSDMMCHSVEVARFLLTAPGEARGALRSNRPTPPIANLKWTRPDYARKLASGEWGRRSTTRRTAGRGLRARRSVTLRGPGRRRR